MKQSRTPKYYAYLLRFWREDGSNSWRATLEDPHSGESVGFASLPQLFAFLDKKSTPKNDENKASSTGNRTD